MDPVFGEAYPFITYFLGVTLAAGLGGFRAGVTAITLCTAAVWYWFIPPRGGFDLITANEAVGLIVFVANVSVGAVCAAMLRTALWQLSVSEHRQNLLVMELNHRVKNSLATVQSIARQTARHAGSLDEFLTVFEGRVIALGRTHELLARNEWSAVEVAEVVRAELAPYESGAGEPARVTAQGPSLSLLPTPAVSLGMILHELATNSAKYGALSASGLVEVAWSRRGPAEAEMIWTERGGPPVRSPVGAGFGTRLIERLARSDLGGGAELRYEPAGLVAVITFDSSSRAPASLQPR